MSLFKPRSKRDKAAKPEANGLQLPVVGNSNGTSPELSLEEKLRMEVRHCPTCSYEVSNPMTDRCPRCFSLIPLSEHTNCGDCSHQGNCVFKQLEEGK
jgi:hypothetical protein